MLYRTIWCLKTLGNKAFANIVENGENACDHKAFYLFKNNAQIPVTLSLTYSAAFSLDKSKILSICKKSHKKAFCGKVIPTQNISMLEYNTILRAYTRYRHLE